MNTLIWLPSQQKEIIHFNYKFKKTLLQEITQGCILIIQSEKQMQHKK